MSLQILHSAPSFDNGRHVLSAPSFASWLESSLMRARSWFAQSNERRRVQREYRRDLALLAGLGERELADFGAPGWLRADVQRYR